MRNQSEAKLNPKPGSAAAQEAGCTCPVMDNHYGAGRGGDGKTYGWYERGSCIIHGFEDREPPAKPKTERKNPGFAPVNVPAILHWVRSGPPHGIIEKFLVSDFMETTARTYSKLLQGFHVRADRHFRCPGCNQIIKEPPSGIPTHHGCGISFRSSGNSLQVWKTEK